jgi:hypothetical protein
MVKAMLLPDYPKTPTVEQVLKVGKADERFVISDVGTVKPSHLIASRFDLIENLFSRNFFAWARPFQLSQDRLLSGATRVGANRQQVWRSCRGNAAKGSRQQG